MNNISRCREKDWWLIYLPFLFIMYAKGLKMLILNLLFSPKRCAFISK